ncbi:phosphoribosylaminoimidazolesuccinocarboxamide synthase [Streptomyces sp. TRM 70351]|uniref:phosphoribosylaminoimidazolesuccinocarboxamide synthase n=1 Tax=Streptomyces sp. TRM 70351 TaxID=3116552 RepID=UPI002E7B91FF|nr:phosphoribosylaminoimidazolesuccinocarboxamide synthase [Streptomyces sp. TRM 70351]MEE1931524.1 phosphoribosylaminoimidazolesuccinocarboxamide synthase [Streptomyces sp. TRM 70351]
MPVLNSTKNLHVIEPPTAKREGVGVFEYTDHYTVFHYGRMPDAIPGKGEAICRMAAFNFRLLEEAGVRTHFRRFIAPNRIEFTLARLPEQAARPLTPASGNYLLPLQVLFRNELPPGSSVHRRLATGDLAPADVGLDAIPPVGEKLKQPLIEYATTRDDVNRFLTPAHAQDLAGLDDEQFQALREITFRVNAVLTGHADKLGLSHCDGKAEYLMSSDQQLVLADSPGTPDESRLMRDGVHCGKQVLRDWYVRSGNEIPTGKLIADGVPRSQWPQPASLPPEFLPVMTDLYRSLSQTWTGEQHQDAPDLLAAARAVADLTNR